MRGIRGTLLGVTLVCAATGVLPSAAGAARLCVGNPGGTCNHSPATVQAAFDIADDNPDRDTIALGAGTFSTGVGGATYAMAGSPIDVVGKGDASVLQGLGGGLSALSLGVYEQSSTVSNVRILSAVGLTNSGNYSGTADLADLSIAGPGASILGGATARRLRVQGATGGPLSNSLIYLSDGVVLTDSLVRVMGPDVIGVSVNAGAATVLDTTIVGDNSASATAIRVNSFQYTPPFGGIPENRIGRLDISGTVVRGAATTIGAHGANSLPAAVTVRYSSIDLSAAATDLMGTGSITPGPGNIGAPDAWFVNAPGANFDLRPGSPLINAGDPAAAAETRDVRGRPRVQSGRRDIGAYEAVPAATPPPVDRLGPKLAISTKRVRLTKGGKLKLTLTCPQGEPSCGGTVAAASAKKLRLKKKAKKKTLTLFRAKTFKAFTPAKPKAASFTVSKAARKRIKALKKLSVKITVVGRDRLGNKATATKKITVLPYKAKKKRKKK